jgi:predicted nucleic acid-binding protein
MATAEESHAIPTEDLAELEKTIQNLIKGVRDPVAMDRAAKEKAFAIASAARIGVHDCLYVALAEREGCELLTADARLIRTLQPTFPGLPQNLRMHERK